MKNTNLFLTHMHITLLFINIIQGLNSNEPQTNGYKSTI